MAGEVYLGGYDEVIASWRDGYPGAGDLQGEVLTWDGHPWPAYPCIADTWIELANPDTAHGDEESLDMSEAGELMRVTSAWDEDVTWNTRPSFTTTGRISYTPGGWRVEDGSMITAAGIVLKGPALPDGTKWVLLKFHAAAIGKTGLVRVSGASRESPIVQGGAAVRPVFIEIDWGA